MKFRTYEVAAEAIFGNRPDVGPESECMAAARMVAARCKWMKEAGFRIRDWRHGPKTPASWRHPAGFWELRPDFAGDRWLDHPYKLVTPKGREVFVSEPYHLTAKGLAALSALEEQGWRVDIHPEMAIHFPGRTIAIWITRKEAA